MWHDFYQEETVPTTLRVDRASMGPEWVQVEELVAVEILWGSYFKSWEENPGLCTHQASAVALNRVHNHV